MNLKEYAEELNIFLKTYPRAARLPIVYSIDDEGNEYKPVVFTPTLMMADNSGEYATCYEWPTDEWMPIKQSDATVVVV